MGTHRSDRLWLLGGVVVVLILVAASWFLLIHPKYTEAESVRGNAADQTLQVADLQRQVAKLKEQAKQLPALTAKLASYQSALPSTNEQNVFLRQLQTSGTADNVVVSGVAAGNVQVSGADKSVMEMPIALTVDGTSASVSSFLNRLQNVQARAILITNVALSMGEGTGDTQKVSASLTMAAFVSSAGSSTTITTK